MPGGVEEADRGEIGRLLLGALVGEKVALHEFLAAHRDAGDAGACSADFVPDEAAPGEGAGRGEHADHREDLGVGDLLAQPGEMAAGDVAGLVRDDADDLVRRVGVHEGADVDEDFWPLATKALKERSLTRTIFAAEALMPAARKIGGAYSRRSCSVSTSRTIGTFGFPSCARAAGPSAIVPAASQDAARLACLAGPLIHSNISLSSYRLYGKFVNSRLRRTA